MMRVHMEERGQVGFGSVALLCHEHTRVAHVKTGVGVHIAVPARIEIE